MSQEKSKKGTHSTQWSQCDKCSIIISNKDIELHSTECPNVSNTSYGYIKEKTLYGHVSTKTNEDIKNVSSTDKDNLIFLSQSAMQLCLIAIGDFVLVKPFESVYFAKIAWPTKEKSLTSVLFTKNSCELLKLADKSCVEVRKISEHIGDASEVIVTILNAHRSLEISSELVNRISKTLESRLVAKNNIFSVYFYGKMLKVEIKDIYCNESEISVQFDKLSLNDGHFYKISSKTTFKISNDSTDINLKPRESIEYNLAGLDSEISEIKQIMDNIYSKNNCNILNSKSILIYGHSGTGKSTLAKFLANEYKVNTFFLSYTELYNKNSSNYENIITEIYETALEKSPSIIIIDDIDNLCPNRSNRLNDNEKRIISSFINMFDTINTSNNSKICIIATSNKIDNIDPSFRRPGRLDREIEIPTPNPHSRKKILSLFLKKLPHNISEEDLNLISSNTHGYVGSDLLSLCSHANLISDKEKITLSHFEVALKKVRPSAMRDVQIEIPNTKWKDIGGQESLKLILKQSVEWPLKHSKSFLRLGITPPKGVLMFGPPGCSKTMIAKALANESGLNFLSIKGPELFSKWVGESERAIRDVFRKARQVSPSIVFFDEIDALGSERSATSNASVQERVLAQLLTELDGISPLGDVTILAATNRPDKIDKALLRPGRLDRIVYVPLPDEKTRREIFRIKFEKMPILDVNIDDLVSKTEKYSGAEVNAVCHEAAMMALEENLEAVHVESRHFERALKMITPRTPQNLIKLYREYLDNKT